MAIRKRTISPLTWEDPTFNSLSVAARYVFLGMICNSNDEGYFRADPGSVKRVLFGFDDYTKDEISGWLAELNDFSNIHFYIVKKEKYAHFLNWNKYQKQQADRIQPNEYPVCSICVAGATQVLTEGKGSKGKGSKENLSLLSDDKRESRIFEKMRDGLKKKL